MLLPIIKTIPQARDIPFDNTTNGMDATDVQAAIEESITGGGTGVVPPFIFSKDGNATVGTYLRTGTVPTNLTGQLIKGTNYIVEISVSNVTAVGSTTRIQFVRRTARTTNVDIANAYVDILSGEYKGANTGISIEIGPDWEIGCYVKSGVSLSNAVAVIYLTPKLG
jgi:hypothetical protein